MTAIDIPERFAHDTIQREGEAGQRWLRALPDLVEDLLRRWRLQLDGPAMHGYVGLVLPVRREEEDLVLKVSWRDASNAHEHTALRAWGGRGAVRLIDADADAGALLLERLRPQSLQSMPFDEAVVIAARLLRRLAIPFREEVPALEETAAELRATLPDLARRFPGALPPGLVEDTLARLDDLVPSAERLLVNADLHYENVLAGIREPWLVIDPKVVLGDPEHGVAPLLWNRFDEVVERGAGAVLDRITGAAELDAERARAWTFVRLADAWIWGLGLGLTEHPERCATLLRAVV